MEAVPGELQVVAMVIKEKHSTLRYAEVKCVYPVIFSEEC